MKSEISCSDLKFIFIFISFARRKKNVRTILNGSMAHSQNEFPFHFFPKTTSKFKGKPNRSPIHEKELNAQHGFRMLKSD